MRNAFWRRSLRSHTLFRLLPLRSLVTPLSPSCYIHAIVSLRSHEALFKTLQHNIHIYIHSVYGVCVCVYVCMCVYSVVHVSASV